MQWGDVFRVGYNNVLALANAIPETVVPYMVRAAYFIDSLTVKDRWTLAPQCHISSQSHPQNRRVAEGRCIECCEVHILCI